MKPDKLDQYIKDQLADREIAPSRNLWAEIESQQEANPKKSNFKWVWLAASLLLIAGITAFFNLNRGKENTIIVKQVQVVKEITPETTQPTKVQQENVVTEPSKLPADPIAKTELQKPTQTPQVTPVEKLEKKSVTPENIVLPNKNTIAVMDSARSTPMKKKRYVDPNTLLFSVENKETIQKTKDGSNVASIELKK